MSWQCGDQSWKGQSHLQQTRHFYSLPTLSAALCSVLYRYWIGSRMCIHRRGLRSAIPVKGGTSGTFMSIVYIQSQLHNLLGLLQNKKMGTLIQKAGKKSFLLLWSLFSSAMVIFICNYTPSGMGVLTSDQTNAPRTLQEGGGGPLLGGVGMIRIHPREAVGDGLSLSLGHKVPAHPLLCHRTSRTEYKFK